MVMQHEAAGIVDLQGLADRLAAPVADAIDDALSGYRFINAEDAYSVAQRLLGDPSVMKRIRTAVPQHSQLGALLGGQQLLKNEAAQRLFNNCRLRFVLSGTAPDRANGRFEIEDGELAIYLRHIVERAISDAAPRVPTPHDIRSRIRSTLAHELRHAADWAYQNAARPGKFDEETFPVAAIGAKYVVDSPHLAGELGVVPDEVLTVKRVSKSGVVTFDVLSNAGEVTMPIAKLKALVGVGLLPFDRATPDQARKRYINTPTELRSFAGNVAELIWKKWLRQWRQLSGAKLVDEAKAVAPTIMPHVAKENMTTFMQRVVRGLEQLERDQQQRGAAVDIMTHDDSAPELHAAPMVELVDDLDVADPSALDRRLVEDNGNVTRRLPQNNVRPYQAWLKVALQPNLFCEGDLEITAEDAAPRVAPPTFRPADPEEFERGVSQVEQSALDSDRHYDDGTRPFISHDGKAGYAISPSGELKYVWSTARGYGTHAVRDATARGAKYLSAFDNGKLVEFYSNLGFKPVKRTPNWTPGGPDVVDMALHKPRRPPHERAPAPTPAVELIDDEVAYDRTAPERSNVEQSDVGESRKRLPENNAFPADKQAQIIGEVINIPASFLEGWERTLDWTERLTPEQRAQWAAQQQPKMVNPISVSVGNDGTFVFNDGHHRAEAGKILGTTVPVVVTRNALKPDIWAEYLDRIHRGFSLRAINPEKWNLNRRGVPSVDALAAGRAHPELNREQLEQFYQNFGKQEHNTTTTHQAQLTQVVEPKRKSQPWPELQQQPMGLAGGDGLRNIVRVLNLADDAEVDYWGRWYQYAQGDVQRLAQRYNLPFELAAACVAVLSPGNKWAANLAAADSVFAAFTSRRNRLPRTNAYPANVTKCWDMLTRQQPDRVTGPKVTVFYQSLLDPKSVEQRLVLDGHAINIWRGDKRPLKGTPQPNTAERAAMLSDYARAADMFGLSPQAVQAITWYIWKTGVSKAAAADPEAQPEPVVELVPADLNPYRDWLNSYTDWNSDENPREKLG